MASARPESAAVAFVTASITRDLNGASDLVADAIDEGALAPWITSLAGDDRAWVIDAFVLDSASGRARVIVSVASSDTEPIGYLVSLVDQDGWRVAAIEFA